MATMRYVHAVNLALADAMRADGSVIVLGEDVAAAGGSFKATRGLLEVFGAGRVIDTPISESALVSASVGAAMSGLRPVVEIMFMDFITLGMDALVNQAAKARFMFGGRTSVPMVLRTPHGGGLSAGPQHSQCLEAWLAHVPGLKVICPFSPQDVYSLLRSAIEDPDPVVFVEHKALYAGSGEVDTSIKVPIGKAVVIRPGRDVSLLTYGATVAVCIAAADILAREGIDVEVVDLRSIQPWDHETVFSSVARTHRAVVVHEAVRAFGVGAEIAACINEEIFDELDAPVVRVAAPFMPVPFSSTLEKRYAVGPQNVINGVRKVLA